MTELNMYVERVNTYLVSSMHHIVFSIGECTVNENRTGINNYIETVSSICIVWHCLLFSLSRVMLTLAHTHILQHFRSTNSMP